jgi:hypothetical protein
MARRLGDPEALVVALESRQTALFHVAHLDERLELGEEMLALARRADAPDVEALALFRLTISLLEAGRIEDAREAHGAFGAIADARRLPILRHAAACLDVVWALIEDRVDDAWGLADRALQIGLRTRTPSADVDHAGHVLALLYHEGRLSEHVQDIAGLAEARPHLVIHRPVLCLAQLQSGEREAGRAGFEALAAGGFAAVPRDMLWLTVHCVLAEACALLGDEERARALYRTLLPYRTRFVQVGIVGHWGSVERFLGVLAAALGDAAAARAHLDAAVERNEAAGARHAAALARQTSAALWSPRNRSSAATSSGGANR